MFWKFLITLKVRACHLRSLFSSKNENQKNSDIYLIPEGDSSKRWCFWRSKSLLESGGFIYWETRNNPSRHWGKNKTKKKKRNEKAASWGRAKATTKSDILQLVGLGNLVFIREKSGGFENWCLWPLCVAKMCILSSVNSLTDWNRLYRRATRQASPVFQRSRDFTTEGLLPVWWQSGSWSLVWRCAGEVFDLICSPVF